MMIRKWVDFGQEVEVNIDSDDIRSALAESFEESTRDPLGESVGIRGLLRSFNLVAGFLKAVSDKQIQQMTNEQRKLISEFLQKAAARFGGVGDE